MTRLQCCREGIRPLRRGEHLPVLTLRVAQKVQKRSSSWVLVRARIAHLTNSGATPISRRAFLALTSSLPLFPSDCSNSHSSGDNPASGWSSTGVAASTSLSHFVNLRTSARCSSSVIQPGPSPVPPVINTAEMRRGPYKTTG